MRVERRKRRIDPFAIRPTEGTALERFVDLCRANDVPIKPYIERWAQRHEAEQSQGREERE